MLCDDKADADKVRKWSTQAREAAAWYQHEELGYNYRMSNIIAGVVRGQLPYLSEHIEQKRAIYERYKAGIQRQLCTNVLFINIALAFLILYTKIATGNH